MNLKARSRVLVALCIASSLVLSACSSGDGDGNQDNSSTGSGELHLATSTYPDTLDPMVGTNNNTQLIAIEVFEGLVAFDAEMTPQPMLAEAVEISEDSKTYTFPLRDVTFHNGDPVTAADVAASLERAAEITTPGALLFSNLASIDAEADDSVVLNFKVPQGPTVLELLANRSLVVLPASVVESAGIEPLHFDGLVGTGPYQFESEEPGNSVTLTKFEGYAARDEAPSGLSGKKEATTEKLVVTAVPADSTRLTGVQSGQYDWGFAMPADLFEVYKNDPELEVHNLPGSTIAVTFNFLSGKFAKDRAMRQAVMQGINVDEIAAAYGPDETWETNPTIAYSGLGRDSETGAENWGNGDVEGAKELLEQSGYDGSEIVLMNTADFAPINSAAIPLMEQLQAIGFNVTMESVTTTTAQARRAEGDGWDMAVGSMSATPVSLMPNLTCGGSWGGYCSPEMTTALDALLSADESQLDAATDEVQRLVYEDLPYVKLFDRFSVDITSARVEGFNEEVFQKFWNVSKS